jgi:energy-coupling factor transporter ATP-binding protein EcfA2
VALASFSGLTYWYPGAARPALAAVDLALAPGLTMVAGASGGGKSTLLRVFNGLVPHFHGGRIAGAAQVGDLDVIATPTRRLAREVGFVFQDPELQAVHSRVEKEVAFGLENLAVPRPELRERLAEAIHEVGIDDLRGRRLNSLSSGERQRVALASALALRPSLVVLDEPMSQLDPAGCALLMRSMTRLSADGRAVLVAEHRLEQLLPAAGRALLVEAGRLSADAHPRELAARLPSPPGLIRLGLALGWSPLPLSPEEATPPPLGPPPFNPRPAPGLPAWSLQGVAAGHGRPAVEGVDLWGSGGQVTVLMGANGSGKTTLLRVLAGLQPPLSGRVERRPGRVAYLPQNPNALLHLPTVLDEVKLTLARAADPEPPATILVKLGLEHLGGRYPRDLSTGERQRAALAAVLAGSPALALLDEPTRGMDGAAREALGRLLDGLRESGASVVLATHDSELAAEVGDRVVQLAEGRTRELGPPEVALSGDGDLANQVGRLYPGGPVTVRGVLGRLQREGLPE